jgi:hypothetical protein
MIHINVKILLLDRLDHLHQLFSGLSGNSIGIIERTGCIHLILGYIDT